VYDVAPFLTDLGELAPPELEIPTFFVIQSTVIEDCKEDTAVERIESCVQQIAPPWSLGGWR
jgi:hypothetical protein